MEQLLDNGRQAIQYPVQGGATGTSSNIVLLVGCLETPDGKISRIDAFYAPFVVVEKEERRVGGADLATKNKRPAFGSSPIANRGATMQNVNLQSSIFNLQSSQQ